MGCGTPLITASTTPASNNISRIHGVTSIANRARRRANQVVAAKATARARAILDLKSVAMKIIPLQRRKVKVPEVKMIPLALQRRKVKVTEVKMIPRLRSTVKTKVPIEARRLML
jgi:hypothetical protein